MAGGGPKDKDDKAISKTNAGPADVEASKPAADPSGKKGRRNVDILGAGKKIFKQAKKQVQKPISAMRKKGKKKAAAKAQLQRADLMLPVPTLGKFEIKSDPIEQLMSGWKPNKDADGAPQVLKFQEFENIAKSIVLDMPPEKIIGKLSELYNRLTLPEDKEKFAKLAKILVYEIVKSSPEYFSKLDIKDKGQFGSEVLASITLPAVAASKLPEATAAQKPPLKLQEYFASDMQEMDQVAKRLASDIFNLHVEMFSKIEPREFMGQNWTKSRGPHVLEMSNRLDALNKMVVQDILFASTKEKQLQIYQFYGKVLEECIKKKDYAAIFAIGLGLADKSVSRLTYLKKNSPAVSNLLEDLFMNGVLNQNGNARRYREALAADEGGLAVPFLTMMTKDFTFVDDGNPDTLQVSVEDGKMVEVVNLEKYGMYGNVLASFERLQEHTRKHMAKAGAAYVPSTDIMSLVDAPHIDDVEADRKAREILPSVSATPVFSPEKTKNLEKHIGDINKVKGNIQKYIAKLISENAGINNHERFKVAKSKGKKVEFIREINKDGHLVIQLKGVDVSGAENIQPHIFSNFLAADLSARGYVISAPDVQDGKIVLKGSDIKKFALEAGITEAELKSMFEGVELPVAALDQAPPVPDLPFAAEPAAEKHPLPGTQPVTVQAQPPVAAPVSPPKVGAEVAAKPVSAATLTAQLRAMHGMLEQSMNPDPNNKFIQWASAWKEKDKLGEFSQKLYEEIQKLQREGKIPRNIFMVAIRNLEKNPQVLEGLLEKHEGLKKLYAENMDLLIQANRAFAEYLKMPLTEVPPSPVPGIQPVEPGLPFSGVDDAEMHEALQQDQVITGNKAKELKDSTPAVKQEKVEPAAVRALPKEEEQPQLKTAKAPSPQPKEPLPGKPAAPAKEEGTLSRLFSPLFRAGKVVGRVVEDTARAVISFIMGLLEVPLRALGGLFSKKSKAPTTDEPATPQPKVGAKVTASPTAEPVADPTLQAGQPVLAAFGHPTTHAVSKSPVRAAPDEDTRAKRDRILNMKQEGVETLENLAQEWMKKVPSHNRPDVEGFVKYIKQTLKESGNVDATIEMLKKPELMNTTILKVDPHAVARLSKALDSIKGKFAELEPAGLKKKP